MKPPEGTRVWRKAWRRTAKHVARGRRSTHRAEITPAAVGSRRWHRQQRERFAAARREMVS